MEPRARIREKAGGRRRRVAWLAVFGAAVPLLFAGLSLGTSANAHTTPTLRMGHKNHCVAYVQKKMGVKVDGTFDSDTRRAVMDFERRHGLYVNGVVGPSVWKRIGVCPYGGNGASNVAATTPAASASCSYRLARTRDYVKAAACEIGPRFDVKTVYGFAKTGAKKCNTHANGRALDFMVYKDKTKGDELVAYAQAHAARLGISYIIWYQRSWNPKRRTWARMADRGDITANHYDHPHISFNCDGRARALPPPRFDGPNPVGGGGYVQLPPSWDGSYRFEDPTCHGEHYGSADLVNVIRNVAAQWKARYPNGRLNIGDLTAGAGHASHKNGIDFDLDATTNGRDWVADYTRGNYNRQATIELARMFADTGKLKIIFYNDRQVINAFGGKMQRWPNHANHFHVRINTAKLPTWAPECDGRH